MSTQRVSSIEWHDSPKLGITKSAGLRGRAPQIKRHDSEQKFDAEFNKWFVDSNDDTAVPVQRSSDEAPADRAEVTPPVLRIRSGVTRRYACATSPSTSSTALLSDTSADEGSVLESLKEAKHTIDKLIEKRRVSSSTSSTPSLGGMHLSEETLPDRGTESNFIAQGSRDQEGAIGRGAARRPGLRHSFKGACTSTQVVSSSCGDSNPEMLRFATQEPSPIAPPGSRKRKRRSLPRLRLRKEGNGSPSSSSDEGTGPVQSTPISTRRFLAFPNGTSVAYTSPMGGERDEMAYDSMDDESMNLLLSQMPTDSPAPRPSDARFSYDLANPATKSTTLSGHGHNGTTNSAESSTAGAKRKVCVVVKRSAAPPNKTNRTPFRRWRTSEALPAKDVKVGGWSRRISTVTAPEGVRTKSSEDSMPRSASFEPPKSDSFWDDDEFDGVDFSAVDAVN